MSLQVWLPLNGDLRNQGLSDIQVTTPTVATFDNTGKIGKCLLYNDKVSIPATQVASIFNNEHMSITFWYNNNGGSTSNHAICGFQGNSEGESGASRIYDFFQYSSKNDFHWSMGTLGGGVLNGIIPDNTWTHICVIYNSGNLKIYINGILKHDSSGHSSAYTFDKSYYINFGHGQKLNDFRIYDHALSIKEVKELSKGLILHYRLSKPMPNLIPETSPIEKNYTYPASNYSDKFSKQTSEIPSKDKYTLSFYAKSTVTGDKIRAHYYNPNTTTTWVKNNGETGSATDGNCNFTLTTQWQKYWVTYSQSSTTAKKTVIFPRMVSGQGTGTISIKYVKFEEGDKATAWIPNESDILYSAMGYDSDIELDCAPAGNQNDGTIVGTIATAADSPRYETSYYFDGSSYMNITNPFDANTLIKDFSISCWIKKGYSDNTSIRYIYNGIIQLYIYTDGKIRITWNHASDDLSYNSGNTWACGLLIPNNEWIHIVYTFSNGIIKVYKDGEYIGTSDRSNTGNNIRGYKGTTFNMQNSSQAFIGNVSDFRIYCTALSAEDIKELYNTAAQIDKDGNIYTYEFKEG